MRFVLIKTDDVDLEGRNFSAKDVVHNLADAEALLRPRMDLLNAAFSEQQCPFLEYCDPCAISSFWVQDGPLTAAPPGVHSSMKVDSTPHPDPC